jgi:hypothetical protein
MPLVDSSPDRSPRSSLDSLRCALRGSQDTDWSPRTSSESNRAVESAPKVKQPPLLDAKVSLPVAVTLHASTQPNHELNLILPQSSAPSKPARVSDSDMRDYEQHDTSNAVVTIAKDPLVNNVTRFLANGQPGELKVSWKIISNR